MDLGRVRNIKRLLSSLGKELFPNPGCPDFGVKNLRMNDFKKNFCNLSSN